jgi:hypothetical protein
VGRIFLLLFIVINLAAITGFCQQTGIDAEAKLLVNYKHMSAKDKTKFANQRKEQKETWEEDSIPTQFRIPVELLSYRDNASVRSYALSAQNTKPVLAMCLQTWLCITNRKPGGLIKNMGKMHQV